VDTNDLLQVARGIIAKVEACMAITVDRNGDANARVVNPKPLSDAWTVRFATNRRSRKSQEIEQSGRLTLAYQYDAENAYVTLIGRAVITDDVAAKTANWRPESYRWYPGGPADPNVVTSISRPSVSSSGVQAMRWCRIPKSDCGRPCWSVRLRDGASLQRFRNRQSPLKYSRRTRLEGIATQWPREGESRDEA
jgi:general stress protein 26